MGPGQLPSCSGCQSCICACGSCSYRGVLHAPHEGLAVGGHAGPVGRRLRGVRAAVGKGDPELVSEDLQPRGCVVQYGSLGVQALAACEHSSATRLAATQARAPCRTAGFMFIRCAALRCAALMPGPIGPLQAGGRGAHLAHTGS